MGLFWGRVTKPLTWFTLLIIIGSAVTLWHRLPGREILGLRLWGPSMFYLYRYILFIGSFAAIYSYLNNAYRIKITTRILFFLGISVELIVIGQFLGVIPDFYYLKGHSSSNWIHVGPTSPHHAHLAGYLLSFCILLLLLRFKNTKILNKSLLDFALVLLIPVMLISGKRSGWLALIIYIAIVGFYLFKTASLRNRIFSVILMVGGITIFTLIVLNNQNLQNAIFDSYNFKERNIIVGSNFEARFITPIEYLKYLTREPISFLIGTGFASTLTYFIIYGGFYGNNLGGTHNQYVAVLFQLGIPGFLVFMWLLKEMMFAIIQATIENREQRIVFVSGFVSILIYALPGAFFFVGSAYGNYTLYFFVMYALCLRVCQLDSKVS